jgi:hypothetical protein
MVSLLQAKARLFAMGHAKYKRARGEPTTTLSFVNMLCHARRAWNANVRVQSAKTKATQEYQESELI